MNFPDRGERKSLESEKAKFGLRIESPPASLPPHPRKWIPLVGEKVPALPVATRLPSYSHHDGCALPTATQPGTTTVHQNCPGDDLYGPGDDGDGGGAGGGGGEGGKEAGAEEGSEEAAAAHRSVSTGQLLSSTKMRMDKWTKYSGLGPMVKDPRTISSVSLVLSPQF